MLRRPLATFGPTPAQEAAIAAIQAFLGSGADNTIGVADQIKAYDAAGLKLTDDGDNGIFVEDGGNVGFGTPDPTGRIHVDSGTLTADAPITFEQTWNNAGVTFTGCTKDFTDTASNAASLLERWRVGGTTQVSISKSGQINANAVSLADSTTGVIYKGADRFIHNFEMAGTQGENFFAGVNAGNFTLTGSDSGVKGSYNTGVGENALFSLTTGNNNCALGRDALRSNTSGFSSSAVGAYALNSNTTGYNNSVMGRNALYSNTTGDNNSAVGAYALRANTSGSQNVALGRDAGLYQSDGSTDLETPENSIYIGYNAKSGSDPAGGEDAIENEVVLGYDAVGLGANTSVIGNSSTSITKLFGALRLAERSADPSDPPEGEMYIWMGDGSGTGDDGDICVAVTAGATTKKAVLFDFSAA